jgi:uncharacterized protein YcfJ
MKRILGAIICLVLLAVAALPTFAQTRRDWRDGRAVQTRRYEDARRDYYDNSRRVYYDGRYDDRSFWDQHRDKATVAAGAGIGAVLGAVVGGQKGALIGALAGAGGSALYTYKLRDRDQGWHYRR